MRFEFATATRIVFGPGTAAEVPASAAEMGARAFVLTGQDVSRADWLTANLRTKGMDVTIGPVPGEPTTDLVLSLAESARKARCDVAIAIGGGSVLDAGKAVAALLTNEGDLFDYLEVIGKGQPLKNAAAPCIAVPTTAGTGAEVTRNAVLGSPEHRVKVSLRSPLMLPRLAVVDPKLMLSMPKEVTAWTGLDALTQLLEVFVSSQANPLTDGICREGLERAARSLRRAYEHGKDAGAREDMAVAALFGGLALANAKLGAVHGFAGPLGGMYPAPHGVICARLLPHVVEANVRALEERDRKSPALGRFAEVAQILTGNRGAKSRDGVEWIRGLCRDLKVPPLTNYGVVEDEIPVAVEKATRASSMKGNPIQLTEEELAEVLLRALV